MSLKSASSINVVWHDWTIVKCSFLVRGTAPLLTMQTRIWRDKKRGKKGKHLGKIVGGCAVLQNGYAIFRWMRNFSMRMRHFNRSLDLENFSGLNSKSKVQLKNGTSALKSCRTTEIHLLLPTKKNHLRDTLKLNCPHTPIISLIILSPASDTILVGWSTSRVHCLGDLFSALSSAAMAQLYKLNFYII